MTVAGKNLRGGLVLFVPWPQEYHIANAAKNFVKCLLYIVLIVSLHFSSHGSIL